jgi:hypothetical protein
MALRNFINSSTALDTVTGQGSSGGSSKFSTTISVSEETKKAAWDTGPISEALKTQYSIYIHNTTTNSVESSPSFLDLDPAGSSPAEYFFSVAPRVTELSEPYTTTITPTQRGGKFVESHGSIIKNLRIQGTTGVRPNRGPRGGEAGTIPIVGQAIGDLAQQFRLGDRRRQAQSGEKTGFTDITFLRNIFRAYSDIKENDEFSNNIVMIFQNNKDNDSWIVEPIDFKVTRSSKSPLAYDYAITLKTLAPKEAILRGDADDPLSRILNVQRVFSRVQEFNQSLRRTFLIVSTQIRRLEGLGVFAQTQIMAPIINVTRGLGVIRSTGSNFGRALRRNAQTLAENLDEAIDLLTGAPGVEEQDALVRSLRRARITASRILVEPGVRETAGGESADRHDRFARAYVAAQDRVDITTRAPDVGGSRTYLGNERNSSKLAQGTVHKDEDIRSAAGRLLGDRSRWQILATVNGLKTPYFTADGAGDTLAFGEPILFPVSTGGVGGTINTSSVSDEETAGDDQGTLGPVQHAYGRDLRLKSVPVSASGVAYTDFNVNQKGDLSTVVGTPNVTQGILLKFSTEKGELVPHANYGAQFPIGSKATPRAINDFRSQTEAIILSDSRVSRIANLDFIVDGDTILAQVSVVLLDAATSLNLFVPVRIL